MYEEVSKSINNDTIVVGFVKISVSNVNVSSWEIKDLKGLKWFEYVFFEIVLHHGAVEWDLIENVM